MLQSGNSLLSTCLPIMEAGRQSSEAVSAGWVQCLGAKQVIRSNLWLLVCSVI